MADRGHQVRFAKPHSAVNEERVVLLARLVGDRECRRMGELVGRADHKFCEGIALVELRMAVARRSFDGRRTRWHRASYRLVEVAVAGQPQRKLNVDRLSYLRRERLPEQFDIAVADPVAKKTVGGFDRSDSSLHPQKI